jgi:hypothetical protein
LRCPILPEREGLIANRALGAMSENLKRDCDVEKTDLIFLMDALKRGVAEADVAGFLGRSEDEVRDQAKALKRRRLPNDRPAKRNSR